MALICVVSSDGECLGSALRRGRAPTRCTTKREQGLSSCFTKGRGFRVVSTEVGEWGEQGRGREGFPFAGTADPLLHSLVSKLCRGKANKKMHIAQAFKTSKLSFSNLGWCWIDASMSWALAASWASWLSSHPMCGSTNLGALNPCVAVLPAGRALLVTCQCISILHALPQII